MISRFQVVALAFGPLVNITTKSLTIVRVADEIKEIENSLKSRVIRKLKSMWKKPSTSDEKDVSSDQQELIRKDDKDDLKDESDTEALERALRESSVQKVKSENDTEDDTKKDR